MADVLESLVVKLALDGSDYNDGIKKAQGGLDNFAGNAAKVGGALSLAVTTPIVAIGASALGAASDLNETVSKVDTLFGEQAASIQAWAETSDEAFGLSKQAALDSVGTIGNMFQQLGSSSEQAAASGQSMVALAADIASFHNVAGGSEEVLDSLNAAFRGEYDSLQKYIPTINAAAVEQAALAATGKTTASELTALDKALAVQTLVLDGAGAAVGDFARTSDGLANTQRIMSAELANVSAELGQELLPVALEVSQGLRGLLGWFKDLSPETKKWIVVIAAAAAAIGPVLLLIAGMASGISAIIAVATAATPVIIAIGAGIAALALPITIVIAAVALLAAAWATDFGGIKTKTQEFGSWITTSWPGWMGNLKQGWEGFSSWWQSDSATKVASVKSGWEGFTGWLSGNVQSATSQVKGYWQSHSTEVENIQRNQWATVKGLVETGVTGIGGVLRAAVQIMQGDWQGGFDTLRTTAETMWSQVGGIFQTQLDTLKNLFALAGWPDLGEDIAEGIANGVSAGIDWITDAARDAAQAALDAAKWVLGISSPSKAAEREVGVPFGQGVGVGAVDAIPAASNVIQDALNALVGSLDMPSLGMSGGAAGGNTFNITIYASDNDTANNAKLGLLDALREVGLA